MGFTAPTPVEKQPASTNNQLLEVLDKLKQILSKLSVMKDENPFLTALQQPNPSTAKLLCERISTPVVYNKETWDALLVVTQKAIRNGDVSTLRYFHKCWLEFNFRSQMEQFSKCIEDDLIINAIKSGNRATMLYVKDEMVKDFTYTFWNGPYMIDVAFMDILDQYDDANILRIMRIVKKDLHATEFPNLIDHLIERRKFPLLIQAMNENLLTDKDWAFYRHKRCICASCNKVRCV